MSATVALALGCLLQGPWNSLPVIDCNEGPRFYGAELRLKDGHRYLGYIALHEPLPAKAKATKVTLFKPDCGLTFFRDPDVIISDAEPLDDCLFDEYATVTFKRAWLPSESVLNLPAGKIKSLKLFPEAWDGISSERFLLLNHAERNLISQGGPRVPVTDYQGSGRLELVGAKSVKEDLLWELAKPVAKAVKAGGKKGLAQQKQQLLKKKIVLLFYPDVEP
jgi:hypothetical protein